MEWNVTTNDVMLCFLREALSNSVLYRAYLGQENVRWNTIQYKVETEQASIAALFSFCFDKNNRMKQKIEVAFEGEGG